jgi:hypothetical protein
LIWAATDKNAGNFVDPQMSSVASFWLDKSANWPHFVTSDTFRDYIIDKTDLRGHASEHPNKITPLSASLFSLAAAKIYNGHSYSKVS